MVDMSTYAKRTRMCFIKCEDYEMTPLFIKKMNTCAVSNKVWLALMKVMLMS